MDNNLVFTNDIVIFHTLERFLFVLIPEETWVIIILGFTNLLSIRMIRYIAIRINVENRPILPKTHTVLNLKHEATVTGKLITIAPNLVQVLEKELISSNNSSRPSLRTRQSTFQSRSPYPHFPNLPPYSN